jgi:glycine cleavage system H protein
MVRKMSDDVKIYMGTFWVQSEGGVVTLGLTEETIADFDEILSFDFPEDQQAVEADEVCGTIETNDGPIDIYSPVTGAVVEVNTTLIEDSSILMDDPNGEGWLLKFSAEEDYDDDDDDEEDEDEEEEEDEDEDED